MATSAFHPGEQNAQRLAGTRGVAEELSPMLTDSLPTGYHLDSLLSSLRLLSVSSVTPANDQGPHSVWVSVLFGKNFVSAPDPNSLHLNGNALSKHDILRENIRSKSDSPVGIVVLDFLHRRRFRVNGVVRRGGKKTTVSVTVREAFGNCPKYIQMRDVTKETSALPGILQNTSVEADTKLSQHDKQIIRNADTFFLGTYYERTGADVNHRGGMPGFVRVTSDNELFWPDYRGNGMFQSFGNLETSERAGLAFVDFETGHVLQVSGSARVEWDSKKTLDVEPAAERIVRFHVDQVRRSKGPLTNYRWETFQYSPYNPVIPAVQDKCLEKGTFPMKVELVKITKETANVKTFRFLAPTYISFLPGQYGTFDFGEMPELNGESGNIIRTWTLSEAANSTKGDVTLEVSVKRKEGGLMSNWLHDHAKIGLKVDLLGIDGDMTPFKDSQLAEKFLFISGGIGITPNMAILRGIGARSQGKKEEMPDIIFIHQERNKYDIPFRQELMRRAWVSQGRTRLIMFASGEDEVDAEESCTDETIQVRSGRINSKFLKQRVCSLQERVVYLCGPTGFMQSVSDMLGELGVRRDQIVMESFNF